MKYAIIVLLFALSAQGSDTNKWIQGISQLSDAAKGGDIYVLIFLAGVEKGALPIEGTSYSCATDLDLLWLRARLRADALEYPTVSVGGWYQSVVRARCSS